MTMSPQVLEQNIHALNQNIKLLAQRMDVEMERNRNLQIQMTQASASINELAVKIALWQSKTAGTGPTS